MLYFFAYIFQPTCIQYSINNSKNITNSGLSVIFFFYGIGHDKLELVIDILLQLLFDEAEQFILGGIIAKKMARRVSQNKN